MMTQLIDLICNIPPENCEVNRGFKYPFNASEVLASSNKQIVDKFFTGFADLTKSIKLDNKEGVINEDNSNIINESEQKTKIAKDLADSNEVKEERGNNSYFYNTIVSEDDLSYGEYVGFDDKTINTELLEYLFKFLKNSLNH